MIRSAIFRRTLATASTRAFSATSKPALSSSAITPSFRPKLHNQTLSVRHFHQTSAKMVGVTDIKSKSEWDTALGDNETLIVLDCFATWCGPCKAISPKVHEFSNEYTDAKFLKIDVDEVPDVAQELGIRAMPTFLLFKNGQRVGEVVGANPKALEAAIKGNL